ncbi:MAG: DUF362 domain-containing protein, partial [bacterium]|nr:DUF362 domain-containing protein [bacterium]
MAKVYLIRVEDGCTLEEQALALNRLYVHCQVDSLIDAKDFVAIKLSVGEENNDTHLKGALAKVLVDHVYRKKAYPFLAETSTLYKGERMNAVKHSMHAHKHGFGIEEIGAPFIMVDGLLGNSEIDVKIDGELFKSVKIAREAVLSDVIITLSHPTGHMVTGLGSCLKNLGMGLASRMGKMRQHSALKPEVIRSKCTACLKCIEWCPEDVITEDAGKARIDAQKCIGCGECLAVCRFDAIKYDWNADPSYLQKAMAEYAYGSLHNKLKKSFHFSVLVDMTKDCDCMSRKQHKIIPDLGIL